ncbi:uncharacterized protein LOC135224222 [Macrobrachium nipponense]|uniref:uncharacterized protein LOC135224222 n=1 Tax=Macrobrachium nipponense TaxID=159736 RepID=UPI0030C8077A
MISKVIIIVVLGCATVLSALHLGPTTLQPATTTMIPEGGKAEDLAPPATTIIPEGGGDEDFSTQTEPPFDVYDYEVVLGSNVTDTEGDTDPTKTEAVVFRPPPFWCDYDFYPFCDPIFIA